MIDKDKKTNDTENKHDGENSLNNADNKAGMRHNNEQVLKDTDDHQILALKSIQDKLVLLQTNLKLQATKEWSDAETTKRMTDDLSQFTIELSAMMEGMRQASNKESNEVLSQSKEAVTKLQEELEPANPWSHEPYRSIKDLYEDLYKLKQDAAMLIASYNKNKTAREYTDLVQWRKTEFAQKPGIMPKIFRYLSQIFS
jgi:hypothetical protein